MMGPFEDRNKGIAWVFRKTSVAPTEHVARAHTRMLHAHITKNRRRKICKLSIFATIPALIVIGQNIFNLIEKVENHKLNNVLGHQVRLGVKLGKIIHHLQIERGTTVLYISSKKDNFIGQRLDTVYRPTDSAVSDLSVWQPFSDLEQFRSTMHFKDYLQNFRSNVQTENTLSIYKVLEFYTDLITVFAAFIGERINTNIPVDFWTELAAFELLLYGKEQAGIERALGSTYFARGVLPLDDLLFYSENLVLGNGYLHQAMMFSDFTKARFTGMFQETSLAADIAHLREEISKNVVTNSSALAGAIWFDTMTEYINILELIQDELANKIVQHAADENSHLEQQLAACAIQFSIAAIMLPVVIYLVTNIVNITSQLEEKTLDLEDEKMHTETLLMRLEDERERTEELLYQLLPKSVVMTIMKDGNVAPESYKSATIMFSDVVAFTHISSHITPMQVVAMLNRLYMTIDGRLERFDVYKVETIGDGYMVASGLPKLNGDNHVEEIAKLALDLLKTLEEVEIPHIENKHLQLRIGFHTGPCVAGVVGIRMPRYCIFGDTVNTASRMESTGLPMKIQMTECSAELLLCSHNNEFLISERGQIAVKTEDITVRQAS